jgi:hypothetical protein
MLTFSCEHLESGFARIEHYLNRMGYVPIVCNFSSEARHYYGIAQIVVFLAVSTFNALHIFFAPDLEVKRALIGQTSQILDYVLHGAMNVFRAQLESFPATCYLYDKAEFRITYLSEGLRRTTTVS